MHHFNNRFAKFAKRCPKHITFHVGELKLRDLAKFCFFKLIVPKSNFKKIISDVINNYVRKTSLHFSILALLLQSKFLECQCANVYNEFAVTFRTRGTGTALIHWH